MQPSLTNSEQRSVPCHAHISERYDREQLTSISCGVLPLRVHCKTRNALSIQWQQVLRLVSAEVDKREVCAFDRGDSVAGNVPQRASALHIDAHRAR